MASSIEHLDHTSSAAVFNGNGLSDDDVSLRDRMAQHAHLDAELGALLVIAPDDEGERLASLLPTILVPLSTRTMRAWVLDEDDELVTSDPEEAVLWISTMTAQAGGDQVDGTLAHNEERTLPDGRRIQVLTVSIPLPSGDNEHQRPEVSPSIFAHACWATVAQDLNNPQLCPPLSCSASDAALLDVTDLLAFERLDQARLAVAGAALERHALQHQFKDLNVGAPAASGSERPRL